MVDLVILLLGRVDPTVSSFVASLRKVWKKLHQTGFLKKKKLFCFTLGNSQRFTIFKRKGLGVGTHSPLDLLAPSIADAKKNRDPAFS